MKDGFAESDTPAAESLARFLRLKNLSVKDGFFRCSSSCLDMVMRVGRETLSTALAVTWHRHAHKGTFTARHHRHPRIFPPLTGGVFDTVSTSLMKSARLRGCESGRSVSMRVYGRSFIMGLSKGSLGLRVESKVVRWVVGRRLQRRVMHCKSCSKRHLRVSTIVFGKGMVVIHTVMLIHIGPVLFGTVKIILSISEASCPPEACSTTFLTRMAPVVLLERRRVLLVILFVRKRKD